MKVRLVTITPNAEQLISDCARVSNPANQGLPPGKLMQYLVRNQHWSPFEMANAVVEIETTRDIARQILRHRSFAFQEFSQRYADVNALPEAEYREVRTQHPTNRQSSVGVDTNDPLAMHWEWMQAEVHATTQRIYREAIDLGIAKEVARAVLPEGMTPSRMYMNGTIRSWIHYIQLRKGNGTQKEHQDIAVGIDDIFKKELPNIWEYV